MGFKVTDRVRLQDLTDGTAMLVVDENIQVPLNGFELKCLKAACEEMIGLCYRRVKDERRGL